MALHASAFEASAGFTGRVLMVALGAPEETLRDPPPPVVKTLLSGGARSDETLVLGLDVAVDVSERGRRGTGRPPDTKGAFEFLRKALEPWSGPGLGEHAEFAPVPGEQLSATMGRPTGPVRLTLGIVPTGDAVRITLSLDQEGCRLNDLGTLGGLRAANLRAIFGRYFTLADPSGGAVRMGEVNARLRREVKRAFGQ